MWGGWKAKPTVRITNRFRVWCWGLGSVGYCHHFHVPLNPKPHNGSMVGFYFLKLTSSLSTCAPHTFNPGPYILGLKNDSVLNCKP